MNEALLALERDSDPHSQVQATFRALHTMKGMAAAMGHSSIAAASHAAEGVLASIGESGEAPGPALVDALFATVDWIEGALELLADGASEPDAATILARLRAVAPESAALDMPVESLDGIHIDPPVSDRHAADPVAPDAAGSPQVAEGPDPATPAAAGTARAIVAERRSMVRVDLQRLDTLMALTGELVIARGRVMGRALALGDGELLEAAAQLDRLVSGLQSEVLATRMVPAGAILDRFPRFVRDAARELGKAMDFELEGRDIELDRSLLEELGEPLVHLLRNAVDHGLETPAERRRAGKPESGTLSLTVTRERDGVVIRVADDGRGVDRQAVLRRAHDAGLLEPGVTDLPDDELLRVLGAVGFSTSTRVTELSGRGVGVDAVLATVRRLGGTVDLRTAEGEGTSWSLRLPATLAIVRALLARVSDETYALPATHVLSTADLDETTVATVRGRDVVVLGEEVLPVVRLRAVVGLDGQAPSRQDVVVIAAEDRRVGLLVDELVAQEEIVVKPFDGARDGARLFSGATVLADGAPALIVDVGNLL